MTHVFILVIAANMNLTQTKLSKLEWTNIEIPISSQEKSVIQLILNGYTDLNIRTNPNLSLVSLMKITDTPDLHTYVYFTYFEKTVTASINAMSRVLDPVKWAPIQAFTLQSLKKTKTPNKATIFRFQNINDTIASRQSEIFDFVLVKYCDQLIRLFSANDTKYTFYLYTLIHLQTASIAKINPRVLQYVALLVIYMQETTPSLIEDVVYNAYATIEQNPNLLKYEDQSLYDHQKQLFQLFKTSSAPKLVLYTAPTGTGKTMSPIGLSSEYRVIFICAARHIGLALAKTALSMQKKIAFAFGCEKANDIRLHFYAASKYERDRRSGGIRKVDNEIGDKVEIIICDVMSYLVAMHYMLSCNPEPNIVLFWDEPTISLDYDTHELHAIIQRNWEQNQISKVVLSCATLPSETELLPTIEGFMCKFNGAEIHTITSVSCKKTITMFDKNSSCILPHLVYNSHADICRCVLNCTANTAILRYFDLAEIVRFIKYMHSRGYLEDAYLVNNYFSSVANVTMNELKIYYLRVLSQIQEGQWPTIYGDLQPPPRPAATSPYAGILFTTVDAHTLTHGPSIYLAENVEKIGNFYISMSKIPASIFDGLLTKIATNSELTARIDSIFKLLQNKLGKEAGKENKMNRESEDGELGQLQTGDINRLTFELDSLRNRLQPVALDQTYIPNTIAHQEKWTGTTHPHAFTPIIEETVVCAIMALSVTVEMKILLLMGIGMFMHNADVDYLEIMKRLAYEQQLYLIIAFSDYIYGTNHQLCHSILGKDLVRMTQQKIIQALGRVGRGNVQHTYTIRFRDDNLINTLLLPDDANMEAFNMNRLLA